MPATLVGAGRGREGLRRCQGPPPKRAFLGACAAVQSSRGWDRQPWGGRAGGSGLHPRTRAPALSQPPHPQGPRAGTSTSLCRPGPPSPFLSSFHLSPPVSLSSASPRPVCVTLRIPAHWYLALCSWSVSLRISAVPLCLPGPPHPASCQGRPPHAPRTRFGERSQVFGREEWAVLTVLVGCWVPGLPPHPRRPRPALGMPRELLYIKRRRPSPAVPLPLPPRPWPSALPAEPRRAAAACQVPRLLPAPGRAKEGGCGAGAAGTGTLSARAPRWDPQHYLPRTYTHVGTRCAPRWKG